MNVDEGLNDLTQNEAKLASYHNTPFTKLCLGMTRNEVTNWILVNYTATSLYSVIADGNLRKTNVGKEEWKSLINGASLQKYCNKEGFNVKCHRSKSRIGIVSNDQDDCASCDSGVGFGIEIVSKDTELRWSSGNVQLTRTTRKLKTFGYIFVQ